MDDAHTELRKFCINQAIQTKVRQVDGADAQAPVLDTAKQYYSWLIGEDDEKAAVNS